MPKSKKNTAKASAKKRPEAGKESQREQTEADREDRREAARKKKQNEIRKLKAQSYAIKATAGIIVVGGLFLVFRPGPEVEGAERPPNDGRGHVANATFSSSTPTSGPHSSRAPSCGTYRDPLELDLAVHALEHGVVVLWHDAERPELAPELQAATSDWASHVIISPNDDLDSPVVATAWNRRMEFAEVSDVVTEFVDVYRNRGPERVGCDIA